MVRQYRKKVVICCEVNHCQYLSSTVCFIRMFQHGFLLVTLRLIDCLHYWKPTHRGRIRNQQQQFSLTSLLTYHFHRAMHFSAKRGIAIARRLSVCPSVRPSVTLVDCDHIGWNSSKIISPLVSLGCSLFATLT